MNQTEVNRIIQKNLHIKGDFSQWEHYGPLLEEVKDADWFGDFLSWFIQKEYLNELPLDTALMVFFDIMTCIRCDDRHGSFIIAEFTLDNPSLFAGKED